METLPNDTNYSKPQWRVLNSWSPRKPRTTLHMISDEAVGRQLVVAESQELEGGLGESSQPPISLDKARIHTEPAAASRVKSYRCTPSVPEPSGSTRRSVCRGVS